MIEHGELSFKGLRLEPGGQEVIVRAGNYEICKAAFDKALFVYWARPRTTQLETPSCIHLQGLMEFGKRRDFLGCRLRRHVAILLPPRIDH